MMHKQYPKKVHGQTSRPFTNPVEFIRPIGGSIKRSYHKNSIRVNNNHRSSETTNTKTATSKYIQTNLIIISMTDSSDEYDLLVIGAGSGGVRASRIAAGYGAKVAVIEPQLTHGAPNYSA